MAIGPTIIIDKSVLQALNVSEAVLLDSFFMTTVTPIFIVETLADVALPGERGRSGEAVAAVLAYKSPERNGTPTAFHQTLLIEDLLGNHPTLDGRTQVMGAEFRRDVSGRTGLVHPGFPEAEAFQRWQKGEFQEVERAFASKWRAALNAVDFEVRIAWVKNLIAAEHPTTLENIKAFVDGFVSRHDRQAVAFALHFLEVPIMFHSRVLERFDASYEAVSVREFAPYAAHVLSVLVLFYIALLRGLVSKERASNLTDVAYLYYLPFCRVFATGDKQQAKLAALFLGPDQALAASDDLKAALKEIGKHYEANHRQEIETRGLLKFASHPPLTLENAVTRLYDRFLPSWREDAAKPGLTLTPEQEHKIIEQIMRHVQAEPSDEPIDPDDADFIFTKKVVHRTKGTWRVLPPYPGKGHGDPQ